MSKKIKINYERIIDEISLIDNRIMHVIVSNIFVDKDIQKLNPSKEHVTANNLAGVIMLRAHNVEYISLLKEVIKRNNSVLNNRFNTTMTVKEIAEIIDDDIKVAKIDISHLYFMVMLYFFSKNVFISPTAVYLKKRSKEIFEQILENEKAIEVKEKKRKYHISKFYKGSDVDAHFNSMVHEYPNAKCEYEDGDAEKIAEYYHCKYNAKTKRFTDVKRGVLFFLQYHFEKVLTSHQLAASVVDKFQKKSNLLDEYKNNLLKLSGSYINDKKRIISMKSAMKSLKRENKRLNTQVLKKIDKSNNIELEKSVHNLQKENNYNLSRIEKMEEQIAVFEEEKKLNLDLQENVEVKELPKKDKLAFSETEPPIIAELPEYQNIVIMGGRWTSNNRKEVMNYLANNDIEFIEADKTLRHFDKITNADVIFFDTSYNSHNYYYRAKKCNNEFYHINTSSLIDIKKIYE
jgi:hypothetical protein